MPKADVEAQQLPAEQFFCPLPLPGQWCPLLCLWTSKPWTDPDSSFPPHSNSLSLLCLLCGLHSISCGDARRPPSAESDTPQLLLKPMGGGLPCTAFSSDCGGHWGPANTTLAELPTVSPHLLRDPREPQHLPSSQSLPRGL